MTISSPSICVKIGPPESPRQSRSVSLPTTQMAELLSSGRLKPSSHNFWHCDLNAPYLIIVRSLLGKTLSYVTMLNISLHIFCHVASKKRLRHISKIGRHSPHHFFIGRCHGVPTTKSDPRWDEIRSSILELMKKLKSW